MRSHHGKKTKRNMSSKDVFLGCFLPTAEVTRCARPSSIAKAMLRPAEIGTCDLYIVVRLSF